MTIRAAALVTFLATPAATDPAVVERIVAADQGGSWRFDVTLSHADTGWDDYADGWRVETADGTVLATRELLHPHETEQPFTRALMGVVIPPEAAEVFVRARTNIEGWDEARFLHRLRD